MNLMSEELKAKAEVAKDLILQGAGEVNITGSDLKVIKGRPFPSASAGTTQVVHVNAQASAHSVQELGLRLHLFRKEIEARYAGNEEIKDMKEKLDLLEQEIGKKSPNQNVLKKIAHWALNAGWDIFLRLMPIIIDKLNQVAP